jgi:uncharacterized protein (TIGR02453 family)
MAFSGFPPEALKFFASLARNNDREWFQPRKEIFDTRIKAPMLDLIAALNEDLAKVAPAYTADPKKAVYRIYRDTRFSPDKTPYKTHIAAIFPRKGGERGSTPGFYFHISAKEVGIAGGLYEPQPEHLYSVRSWLVDHHKEFRKATRSCKKLMGDMYGESLKRVPKGFDSEHPAADLLKMKRWVVWTALPAKLATTPELQKELIKRFKAMLPMTELLDRACAGAKKRAAAANFLTDF